MNILKRVQFYCLGLAAILATVLAFPALAAGPMAKNKRMTFWHPDAGITVVEKSKGKALALPKLTVNTVRTCQGINVGPEYTETPTTVTTYIFVAPAPCTTSPNAGIWFEGAFETLWPAGTAGGVSFFKATLLPGETVSHSALGYASIGDEVIVAGPNELQVKLGTEVFTIYTVDTYIVANVANTTSYGTRRTPVCGSGGCTVGTESLFGFIILDKAIASNLGSVVFNHLGETVGILIGNDMGMSAVISAGSISSAASQLGINLGMKG